jgi:hypothetical protein
MLTTIADHNDIRHSPIERVTSEAKFPGERRHPTGWRCLTSERSDPMPAHVWAKVAMLNGLLRLKPDADYDAI